ncbi:transposase InsO family protein [Kibdelosporangium banguiense]|uniref:Transposase InsO family protein n=1 Tax=Kibdelosporangium banguiense TaxID=1365924 RepID=A0ABS4TYP6_9PSEU|nr:IS3 family transposase [Kibdelosporangium banguiense]MBP2329536.1 transposase InsO family protein [Kibdelosporangium banguiense]
MSLAVFIADQRTSHDVPHAVACRALTVSESWFYKWHHRQHRPTPSEQRRVELDAAVAEAFEAAHGLHGSPRVLVDVRAAGWTVSEKTVAKSMARQGLVARAKKRRKNLTRPDKRAVPFPDLVKRDFTASAPNMKWVGDMTEIPTGEGKFYLSTAIDLFSRRLLGYATSCHPDAELAGETIKMAVAARGGKDRIAGVVFHSDRGSTYTAHDFTALCRKLGIQQSMGRTGSCFDNAAAESFFSTLEHEVLSRHHFKTRKEAQQTIVKWAVDFYNRRRRHSSCGMQSPIDYETTAANRAA